MLIYALPMATQHVNGGDGISAKEVLAHGLGSGLWPLTLPAPAWKCICV